MRILAISAQVPYPPHHGKAMRDYYLLTGLARTHALRLLCMVGHPAEVEAAAPLAEQLDFETLPLPAHAMPRRLLALLASARPDLVWRTWSAAFRRLLGDHLEAAPPDLLLVEGLEMASYGLWARAWLRRRGRPVPALVLDEHNAEYLLQRRAWEIGRGAGNWPAALYSWVQAGRLARFEGRACRAYDHVIAVSPDDRDALWRVAPGVPIAVVPNGVDTALYTPPVERSPGSHPRLVFSGRMDFRPNVDAALWFAERIWPRVLAEVPEGCFQIVGRDPTPAVQALARMPGVEVTGAVPDDRPYIGGADVYVLPMRFGGGIRFKLLQALSMERAMVSTPLGAEGVAGLVDRQHLFLADRAETFAERVVLLLRHPALRARLGQAGRDLIRNHYDWEVLLPRLQAALHEALHKKSSLEA